MDFPSSTSNDIGSPAENGSGAAVCVPDIASLRIRLQAILAEAERYERRVALLLIDLDGFKAVNDSFGRAAADVLLEQITVRMAGHCRQTDTFARLGGDVFALVLPQLGSSDEAAAAARKILKLFGQAFVIEDQELVCTAGIGIALYPDDGKNADLLLRMAEIAAHRAKELGCNQYHFYDEGIQVQAADRMKMIAELRQAVTQQQFVVFYQPKVACGSGDIVGMEALVRWMHPQRGLVEPMKFIGLLEETGLIVEVGGWVMREACRQVAAWISEGLGRPSIAVNLSARQFESGQLIEQVESVLGETGIPPELLDLELTESILMRDADRVVETLNGLRRLGVHISIDDFGTGYSSLSYLKRFPLDTLKVDRSFVVDITADPNDVSITRAIITLAHSLKLKVVAEGVETEGQYALLVANQCDEVQGYLFARPLPAAEMRTMLSAGRPRPALALAGTTARQRTLLLVDDEENILSAQRRLFRRDGYKILTASGGQEALELLAQNEVDVIVSDQRMPNMTGVEFLRRVKTIHPNTVRIVLSGYTELQSITDAINEGAIYKFLTKPWDDDLLRANIQEAFQHKELGDQNRALGNALAEANAQLQRLLEQSYEQITRDEGLLSVLREILQHVPLPVVGVDESGCVVFSNPEADTRLGAGAALTGEEALSCLPAALHGLLNGGQGELEWADQGYRVRAFRMGNSSASRGVLLLFLNAGNP